MKPSNLLDGQFTLGVEEEFQIIDGQSHELRSYISKMMDDGKTVLRERVRTELHQSVVEVGTGICKNIHEVRAELTEMRLELDRLARKGGMNIVAAGTHPFSDWKSQEITPNPRYQVIVEDLQDIARGNLIFGLHVHVGIKDKQTAIALANQIRYFLPHLLALSTSSPFWLGRATGQQSTRTLIFKRFPRTGIPPTFESYSQFMEYVDLLIRTNCIDNGKKIWWDVRVHHLFDTVEIRICDMPTNLEQEISIVSLIQALVAQLYLMLRRNQSWRHYMSPLIEENKWRASRYGIRGKLIDFGQQQERPYTELLEEMIAFVSEASDLLGTSEQVASVRKILEQGTSAERQLEVFKNNNNDPRAVVRWLVEETMRGVGTPPASASQAG
ncbi:carboxylate-amine ligase [Hyalangium rubrum]|uniref:Putative glutamate--cysteine ligase 2 n=1 Tax=Hyalangium rubrum TaxID=3103134 RepID=A0ABU5H0U3_9BACT|nr:carboxylate-amine ligase [Hyalangium sp. s54d21]MDY7226407.1 carboxylate-amine ligase [Hyalangium sp. s54d21]